MKKLVFLFAAIAFVLLISGCATNVPNGPIACTADAKACPDGSYVSRDPNNNCEFFACPKTVIDTQTFKMTIKSEGGATGSIETIILENKTASLERDEADTIETSKISIPEAEWKELIQFFKDNGVFELTQFNLGSIDCEKIDCCCDKIMNTVEITFEENNQPKYVRLSKLLLGGNTTSEPIKKLLEKVGELREKLRAESVVADLRKITLKTNKNIYDKGEKIEFVLLNNSGRSIFIMPDYPFEIYEKGGSDGFERLLRIRESVQSEELLLPPKEIKNGETQVFEWKGTIFEFVKTPNGEETLEEIQVEGRFKVIIEYSFETTETDLAPSANGFDQDIVILFSTPAPPPWIKEPIMTVESNEFDIYSIIEQNECGNNDGQWIFSRDLKNHFCNYKTSDFGRACTDSDQCEGNCIAEDFNSTEGTCSEWKTTFECFLMENEQVKPVCVG